MNVGDGGSGSSDNSEDFEMNLGHGISSDDSEDFEVNVGDGSSSGRRLTLNPKTLNPTLNPNP
jgi:hypothetical protein